MKPSDMISPRLSRRREALDVTPELVRQLSESFRLPHRSKSEPGPRGRSILASEHSASESVSLSPSLECERYEIDLGRRQLVEGGDRTVKRHARSATFSSAKPSARRYASPRRAVPLYGRSSVGCATIVLLQTGRSSSEGPTRRGPLSHCTSSQFSIRISHLLLMYVSELESLGRAGGSEREHSCDRYHGDARAERVSTTVPLNWKEVWFTNCPMVSANNVDQEMGWCREEFKKIGVEYAYFRHAPENNWYPHYIHNLDNLIRFGGLYPAHPRQRRHPPHPAAWRDLGVRRRLHGGARPRQHLPHEGSEGQEDRHLEEPEHHQERLVAHPGAHGHRATC